MNSDDHLDALRMEVWRGARAAEAADVADQQRDLQLAQLLEVLEARLGGVEGRLQEEVTWEQAEQPWEWAERIWIGSAFIRAALALALLAWASRPLGGRCRRAMGLLAAMLLEPSIVGMAVAAWTGRRGLAAANRWFSRSSPPELQPRLEQPREPDVDSYDAMERGEEEEEDRSPAAA